MRYATFTGIVPVLAFWMLGSAAQGQAGPPLVTDDTGTPGPGGVEINLAGTYATSDDGYSSELPLLDFNYGIGETVQVSLTVPWQVEREQGGSTREALGKPTLALKWRFWEQSDQGFAGVSDPFFGIRGS